MQQRTIIASNHSTTSQQVQNFLGESTTKRTDILKIKCYSLTEVVDVISREDRKLPVEWIINKCSCRDEPNSFLGREVQFHPEREAEVLVREPNRIDT